jgi:hypothetical protein
MDQKYVNVIYYNKESNKFALLFIILFLLLPNIGIIFGLTLLYGKELLQNTALLLPLGIYTILNTMLMIFSFFSMENNKEKSIRVLDEGLVYNSLLKKFAIQWDNVERVQFNPFLARRPIIMIHSTKGRFYFSGMFVNVADEIPQIKPGFIKPKFFYPSGGEFEGDIYTNELYLILKETIPEKFY